MDCLAPVHCDPCRLQAVVPCIERAAWAACAEGAVLPRLRRAVTALGTKAGHGVQGAWGRRAPGPLPPAAQATRPFPHKNKKGRKKENSSGRAAPQGSPALPARLCVGRR